MVQSYQDLSKYFPRLNIDKLKTIAQRWVDDHTNTPVNRIVLYNNAPKRQKYFGESKKKYAVVFEILGEYKKYGLTPQELDDHYKATERDEETTLPYPLDPTDEFIHDTEYFETIKPENPFLDFMTADFEDVYWEAPKLKFKKEWELIPRQLVYDAEKNESALMELPDNVRTRENEILFQVQTEEIAEQDIPSANIQNETIDPSIKDKKNVFKRWGKNWVIKYKGKFTTFPDYERIRYIVHLLDRPRIPVNVVDLLSAVKKETPSEKIEQSEVMESTMSEWEARSEEEDAERNLTLTDLAIDGLTKEDKDKFEDQGYEILQCLTNAKKKKNQPMIDKAEKDMEGYKNYMFNEYSIKTSVSSKGIKFIQKKRSGPEIEKARKNVSNQINTAIADIKKEIPSLAQYLRKYIETGKDCIYRPDGSNVIDWHIIW